MHQYIERETGNVVDEKMFGDTVVRFLYSAARENAPALFNMLTGKKASGLLGYLHFDSKLSSRLLGNRAFLQRCGVNFSECLSAPEALNTPRKIFERKIRFWECRPLPEETGTVVSPADARVLTGSFRRESALYLKDKFFHFDELFGGHEKWTAAFHEGDFAIFRLTPDKYHWNHSPVSGLVVDHFELEGTYHSCNPSAVVHMATPFSKNRRFVTVIDTDVPGGTGVGYVAMIEVVALMIGDVVQHYCDERYDRTDTVTRGLYMKKGRVKSLYRPGSSTDILVFEPNRVAFTGDILANQKKAGAVSRYSIGFGTDCVETDILVRSRIAHCTERNDWNMGEIF